MCSRSRVQQCTAHTFGPLGGAAVGVAREGGAVRSGFSICGAAGRLNGLSVAGLVALAALAVVCKQDGVGASGFERDEQDDFIDVFRSTVPASCTVIHLKVRPASSAF